MRNFLPTPNIGLKKKLATRFTIYSIDEFNTSKLNYLTSKKNVKMKVEINRKVNKDETFAKNISNFKKNITEFSKHSQNFEMSKASKIQNLNSLLEKLNIIKLNHQKFLASQISKANIEFKTNIKPKEDTEPKKNIKSKTNIKFNNKKILDFRLKTYDDIHKADDKMLDELLNIVTITIKEISTKMIHSDMNPITKLQNNLALKNEYIRSLILRSDSVPKISLDYKINQGSQNICKYYNLQKKGTPKKKLYELHSVLTCKMKNNWFGCINRDKNAVLNMRKLTNIWLVDKLRPKEYSRGTKSNRTPKTPKIKSITLTSDSGAK